MKFANLTPTQQQCATSIATGEAIVRGTMPTSTGARTVLEEPEPEVDPVAAAQLRAPFTQPEEAPRARVRSPYEPPDPDEPAPAPEQRASETGDDATSSGTASASEPDAKAGEGKGEREPTTSSRPPRREPPEGGET